MADRELFDIPNTTFRLDGGAMFGVVPKALWEREYAVDDANRMLLTTRLILIRDPASGRNILTDPGMGDVWDEKFAGRYEVRQPDLSVEESLAELELTPDDITDVVLTHLHFDHLAGCFVRESGGRLALRFPHAAHHVQQVQWGYAHAPSAKDDGSYTEEHLDALEASGKLCVVRGNRQLLPGIDLFTVEGHTPAQQLLRIAVGDRTWVYGADLFPLEAFLRAPWIMAYDLEPLKTLDAKQRVLKEQLSNGEWLILAHDPHTIAGGPVDFSARYPQLTRRIGAEGRLKRLEM